MKIKKGDKLLCIDDSDSGLSMIKGQEYTVVIVKGNTVKLYEAGCGFWCMSRFEKKLLPRFETFTKF
jgi:hypothetical protein